MVNTLLLGWLAFWPPQDVPVQEGPEISVNEADGAVVPLPPSANAYPVSEKNPPPAQSSERLETLLKKSKEERIENRSEATLPNAGGILFWSFFVLMLFIVGAVILRKLVQKTKFHGAGTIRVLARKPLSPKQHVFLVEVGPKVFLVGSTKDQLSTLGEFSSPDEVASVRTLSPVYNDDSISGTFRTQLKEGLKEAETERPDRKQYGHVMDELKEIRKTVLSWRA